MENVKHVFANGCIVFTLFVSSFISINTQAQDYYHGFGGQVDYGIFNLSYTSSSLDYSETSVVGVPGIVYKSTLGFTDNFALSAYPFLGLSLSVNSQTGGSGAFAFQLPLNAELYLGDMDDGCFFVGAGGAFATMSTSYAGGGTIFGPQLAMGGQFYLGGYLIGLRAAYTIGINSVNLDDASANVTKDSKSLISIGAYYPIGQ